MRGAQSETRNFKDANPGCFMPPTIYISTYILLKCKLIGGGYPITTVVVANVSSTTIKNPHALTHTHTPNKRFCPMHWSIISSKQEI